MIKDKNRSSYTPLSRHPDLDQSIILKSSILKNTVGGNGIFPASIDPRKNISAFVASMEKSRLSEIKFIAGAR